MSTHAEKHQNAPKLLQTVPNRCKNRKKVRKTWQSMILPVVKQKRDYDIENTLFSISFGRTDLIIRQSKATFYEESAGDVRFCVAPQKRGKNTEKHGFETTFFRKLKF